VRALVKQREDELAGKEGEVAKLQEQWSQINRQLMAKEAEIQRERELNLQLQDEKYHALTKLEA
jgi:hypothetical protein